MQRQLFVLFVSSLITLISALPIQVPMVNPYCGTESNRGNFVELQVKPNGAGSIAVSNQDVWCKSDLSNMAVNSSGGFSWTVTNTNCYSEFSGTVQFFITRIQYSAASVTFSTSGYIRYQSTSAVMTWDIAQASSASCALQLLNSSYCGQTDDGRNFIMIYANPTSRFFLNARVVTSGMAAQCSYTGSYFIAAGNVNYMWRPTGGGGCTGFSFGAMKYDGRSSLSLITTIRGTMYTVTASTAQCTLPPSTAVTYCGSSSTTRSFFRILPINATNIFFQTASYSWAATSTAAISGGCSASGTFFVVNSNYALQPAATTSIILQSAVITSNSLTLTSTCNGATETYTLQTGNCAPSFGSYCGSTPSGLVLEASFYGTTFDATFVAPTLGFFNGCVLSGSNVLTVDGSLIFGNFNYGSCASHLSFSSIIQSENSLVFTGIFNQTAFSLTASIGGCTPVPTSNPFCVINGAGVAAVSYWNPVANFSNLQSMLFSTSLGGSLLSSNCHATFQRIFACGNGVYSGTPVISCTGQSLEFLSMTYTTGSLIINLRNVSGPSQFSMSNSSQTCTDPVASMSTYCGNSTGQTGILGGRLSPSIAVMSSVFTVGRYTLSAVNPSSNPPFQIATPMQTGLPTVFISGQLFTPSVSNGGSVSFTTGSYNSGTITLSGMYNSQSIVWPFLTSNCMPVTASPMCSNSATTFEGSFMFTGSVLAGTITQNSLPLSAQSCTLGFSPFTVGNAVFVSNPFSCSFLTATAISYFPDNNGTLMLNTNFGPMIYSVSSCSSIPSGQYCGTTSIGQRMILSNALNNFTNFTGFQFKGSSGLNVAESCGMQSSAYAYDGRQVISLSPSRSGSCGYSLNNMTYNLGNQQIELTALNTSASSYSTTTLKTSSCGAVVPAGKYCGTFGDPSYAAALYVFTPVNGTDISYFIFSHDSQVLCNLTGLSVSIPVDGQVLLSTAQCASWIIESLSFPGNNQAFTITIFNSSTTMTATMGNSSCVSFPLDTLFCGSAAPAWRGAGRASNPAYFSLYLYQTQSATPNTPYCSFTYSNWDFIGGRIVALKSALFTSCSGVSNQIVTWDGTTLTLNYINNTNMSYTITMKSGVCTLPFTGAFCGKMPNATGAAAYMSVFQATSSAAVKMFNLTVSLNSISACSTTRGEVALFVGATSTDVLFLSWSGCSVQFKQITSNTDGSLFMSVVFSGTTAASAILRTSSCGVVPDGVYCGSNAFMKGQLSVVSSLATWTAGTISDLTPSCSSNPPFAPTTVQLILVEDVTIPLPSISSTFSNCNGISFSALNYQSSTSEFVLLGNGGMQKVSLFLTSDKCGTSRDTIYGGYLSSCCLDALGVIRFSGPNATFYTVPSAMLSIGVDCTISLFGVLYLDRQILASSQSSLCFGTSIHTLSLSDGGFTVSGTYQNTPFAQAILLESSVQSVSLPSASAPMASVSLSSSGATGTFTTATFSCSFQTAALIIVVGNGNVLVLTDQFSTTNCPHDSVGVSYAELNPPGSISAAAISFYGYSLTANFTGTTSSSSSASQAGGIVGGVIGGIVVVGVVLFLYSRRSAALAAIGADTGSSAAVTQPLMPVEQPQPTRTANEDYKPMA